MYNNTGEVAGLEKEASCLLSAGCHTKISLESYCRHHIQTIFHKKMGCDIN